MARKHRRRPETPQHNIEQLFSRGTRTEGRRGREWFVRQIPADRATKQYRCPGCGNQVDAGIEHVVVWSADHMFGDDVSAEERRHWHSHCWRLY